MSTRNSRPGSQPVSYCRNRTRDRFPYFFLGLLLLFVGLCMGVYGVVTLGEDKTGWDYRDYVTLVIGWVGCLGFTAAGIYEGCTSLRDTFFPAKSAIAGSIRSQMPRPEDAPDWQELFAIVDRDLSATGRWFGKVGIGSQWLLGDEVSYLPRIRGVFGRDEIRHSSGTNRHTRIVQLFIIDDRKQTQVTSLQDPRDLEAVIQCLRLRVPAAYFGSYHDFIGFCDRTDDEWDQMEREFRRRQAQAEQRVRETFPVQAGQGFVLTDLPSGRRTSQVDGESLVRQLEGLEPGQQFRLEFTPPIPIQGIELVALNCIREENSAYRMVAQPRISDGGETIGFLRVKAKKEEVQELLVRLVERGEIPNFTDPGWQTVPFRKMPAPQSDRQTPPYLNITEGTGISCKYQRFSRRDVELAAQKVADGSYKEAILWLPPWLVFLDAGTAQDGRTTIQIGLPVGDAYRTRMAKTTGRQAAEWFIGCLDGKLPDDFESWKDVTRDWEKRVEKLEKQKAKDAAKK